jgi:hypothetical protein
MLHFCFCHLHLVLIRENEVLIEIEELTLRRVAAAAEETAVRLKAATCCSSSSSLAPVVSRVSGRGKRDGTSALA